MPTLSLVSPAAANEHTASRPSALYLPPPQAVAFFQRLYYTDIDPDRSPGSTYAGKRATKVEKQMQIITLEKLSGSVYSPQVWQLLCACDGEFVPPLSARSDTTQTALRDGTGSGLPSLYFETMCSQSILLALEGQSVAGFMSYRPHYVCADLQDGVDTVYVSTIIVDKAMRGRGITRQMYDVLLAAAHATAMPVSTRTWSTNCSHLTILRRLGFREICRIPDGRGAGIDTVYYRKESK